MPYYREYERGHYSLSNYILITKIKSGNYNPVTIDQRK